MTTIYRNFIKELEKRLLEPRHFMQVLVGPRQVGKTTMVRQLLENNAIKGMYVSADNATNLENNWLEIQWQTAREALKTSETTKYVLIVDEVQKINNWSEVVKYLWDSDSMNGIQLHVVLLGSSRLLVQEGLTESLAGRFEKMYIPHWSYAEMKEAFNVELDEYIWFGGYPGANWLKDDEDRWKSYVSNALIEPAISKDILMLQRIDKPALLRRTFEVATAFSGQIVSYNKIIGQLQDAGNTTTISGYMQLLDSAGLVVGLQKHSKTGIGLKGSIPKFFVHNSALFSAYSQTLFAQAKANPSFWGHVVESAVGAHLINNSFDGRYRVYYWREGNQEVDFVIQKGESIVCLEVKSNFGNASINHSNFVKKNPDCKSLLIGGTGIPLETFFNTNPSMYF